MIPIPGKLTVREISGRRGKFVVGDLATEIGAFKCKDALLDQFSPGVYTGVFYVVQIYPDSYIWQGRVTTEVRARLHHIQLDSEEMAPAAADMPAEPDPLEQTLHQAEPEKAPAQSVPQPAPESLQAAIAPISAPEAEPVAESVVIDTETAAPPDLDDQDRALFGPELYQLVVDGAEVKLDPTIDRAQFRSQRDRLKELGYAFAAASQTWHKKG